jgi:flagellar biosynthesis/type III secretory pathway protein FliH
MEPFSENLPVSSEHMKEIEDAYADATVDYLDGYRQGYKAAYETAFEDGVASGWTRGREEVIYRLRRYAKESFDPEIEQLIRELTGEDEWQALKA